MAKDLSYEIIKEISELYQDLMLTLIQKIRRMILSSNLDRVTVNGLRLRIQKMIRESVESLNVEEVVAQTLMTSLQSNFIDWLTELRHNDINLTANQIEALTIRSRRQLRVAYTEIMSSAKTLEATMINASNQVAGEILSELTAAKKLGVSLPQAMKNLDPIINQFDFIDKANRRWSPQAYMEMASRTQVNNLNADLSRNLSNEIDNDFRVIDTQAGSCPSCFGLHDNVISMHNEATTKEINEIEADNFVYFGTYERAIRVGWHHPNCRCIINVYFPGISTKSTNRDEARNSKNYRDRQQQRLMERNIRKWKMQEASALTTEDQKRAAKNVRQWQANLREFAKKNNLTRMYWRERLTFSTSVDAPIWSKNFILGKTLKLNKDFLEDIIRL